MRCLLFLQANQRIEQQHRDMALLDLPLQIADLEGQLLQKRSQLAICTHQMHNMRESREASEKSLHAERQDMQTLQQHQVLDNIHNGNE